MWELQIVLIMPESQHGFWRNMSMVSVWTMVNVNGSRNVNGIMQSRGTNIVSTRGGYEPSASKFVGAEGDLEDNYTLAQCDENLPEANLDHVRVGDSLQAIAHDFEDEKQCLLAHVDQDS